VGLRTSPSPPPPSPSPSSSSASSSATIGRADARERERVVKFWEGVLGRCRDEGVWLEDWRGWNVTSGSLRRTRGALRAAADGGA
jgi:hypothetical protein